MCVRQNTIKMDNFIVSYSIVQSILICIRTLIFKTKIISHKVKKFENFLFNFSRILEAQTTAKDLSHARNKKRTKLFF